MELRSYMATTLGRLCIVACALLLGIGLTAGVVTPPPDAGHGKQLAERLCSNCHLVGDPHQTKALADVPTFAEIASRENRTAGDIMARIMLPKHPMPQIPLQKSELADLAAYILSLQAER
jgi:mono/diheme cytochrome c family protein